VSFGEGNEALYPWLAQELANRLGMSGARVGATQALNDVAREHLLAGGERNAIYTKSNADWQRTLIVSLYKVGTATAKIGGNDNVTKARGFLQTALTLAENYQGPDQNNVIDSLNQALQNLVHSD